MSAIYSKAFIEQALVKVFSRGDRNIMSVATELNISLYTLKSWMKKAMKKPNGLEAKEKRPKDWKAHEQLVALHETHGLSGEPLNAWCREHGLFAHHLTAWRAAFCSTEDKLAPDHQELRVLKGENDQLKRELLRKEKALVEAAALLILQKKFRALWEGEEK